MYTLCTGGHFEPVPSLFKSYKYYVILDSISPNVSAPLGAFVKAVDV